MANYKVMSVKKLNALLESANEEEKAAIMQELQSREQVAAAPESNEPEAAPESNEPEAAPESNEPEAAPESNEDSEMAKLDAEFERLKAEKVGHKCQYVPEDTLEWVEGVIVGVIKDKRAKRLFYAIRSVDAEGKETRLCRGVNAKLLKISDEVVELPRRLGNRANIYNPEKGIDNSEELQAAKVRYAEKVGMLATFKTPEGVEIKARIITVSIERRSNLYRYELEKLSDDNVTFDRLWKPAAQMLLDVENGVVSLEADEKTVEVNTKYVERITRTVTVTVKEQIDRLEMNKRKMEERLERVKLQLENLYGIYAKKNGVEATENLRKTFEKPAETTESDLL